MGLTVQMNQLKAFKQGGSTWNIKELALEYTPRNLNLFLITKLILRNRGDSIVTCKRRRFRSN